MLFARRISTSDTSFKAYRSINSIERWATVSTKAHFRLVG